MDNIAKLAQAIRMGFWVARFLLNTRNVLKATGVCKECLILLSKTGLRKEEKCVRVYLGGLYSIMLVGYAGINDHTRAIECGRELLFLFRGCGDRLGEARVSIRLAKMYHRRSKYHEAEELYMKVLNIMIEIGEKKEEGICCGGLGTVFQSVGEYTMANKYHEKALAK